MITVSITEKRFGADRVLGPIAFAQARKAVRYGAEGSGIVALRIVAGLATGVSALVLLAPIVLLMTSG